MLSQRLLAACRHQRNRIRRYRNRERAFPRWSNDTVCPWGARQSNGGAGTTHIRKEKPGLVAWADGRLGLRQCARNHQGSRSGRVQGCGRLEGWQLIRVEESNHDMPKTGLWDDPNLAEEAVQSFGT